MTSWIAPTAVTVGNIMAASEDALRVDDLQFLYDHRHDVLYVDRTQTTLANSTTKTLVATYPVPAGALGSTGVLTFNALIRVLCTTSNNNQLRVDVEYGGTALGSVYITANNVIKLVEISGSLAADGATDAQVGIVKLLGADVTGGLDTEAMYAALAIDSTVAADLKFYCTNSRLSTDSSWTYFYSSVMGLP